ncbi:MAG: DUF1819 family protein [Myxococcota bacterium]
MVAGLLLQGLTKPPEGAFILEKNVLQVDSPIGVIRSSNILRARLPSPSAKALEDGADGGTALATQAAFAGAVKHSRLLGDFMDITIREQRTLVRRTRGAPHVDRTTRWLPRSGSGHAPLERLHGGETSLSGVFHDCRGRVPEDTRKAFFCRTYS